jgi:glucose-6-phosphate dehydrogenase assembly protein OpcA
MIATPDEIEQELVRIQRQNSPTEARTTILNLVVFTTWDTKSLAEDALNRILGRRAARVIHITDGEQEQSDIAVSARCYLDQERRSVCFQEVLVSNGRDNVGRAPGSWSPLLIRDLPTYVFWLRPVVGELPLLNETLEHADKLIIDSEEILRGGEAPRQLYEALSAKLNTEETVLSDLAWQRTAELRRLSARTIDAEGMVDALYDIETVELRGGTRMFGMLYLAWLAARLRWRRTGGSLVDRDGYPVSVVFEPGTSLEDDIMLRFSFRSREPLAVHARPDGCADFEGTEHLSGCTAFEIPCTGDLLLGEIDRVHNEWLYMEAVETLVTHLSVLPDPDSSAS